MKQAGQRITQGRQTTRKRREYRRHGTRQPKGKAFFFPNEGVGARRVGKPQTTIPPSVPSHKKHSFYNNLVKTIRWEILAGGKGKKGRIRRVKIWFCLKNKLLI